MPIQSTDLVLYLTGGSSNTDPNASLGGQISSQAITSAQLDNIFDNVSGAESSTGDIEYRCIAVKNNHASLDLMVAKAYISINCPAADKIDIGIEVPAGAPSAVQTVADESTAPTGVTFSRPSTHDTGLNVSGQGDTTGTLGHGHWCGIWIRRTVPASCAAYTGDNPTVTVDGDTDA